MKLLYSTIIAVILSFSFTSFSKPLYIFTSHASVGAASGVFWQAVKK